MYSTFSIFYSTWQSLAFSFELILSNHVVCIPDSLSMLFRVKLSLSPSVFGLHPSNCASKVFVFKHSFLLQCNMVNICRGSLMVSPLVSSQAQSSTIVVWKITLQQTLCSRTNWARLIMKHKMNLEQMHLLSTLPPIFPPPSAFQLRKPFGLILVLLWLHVELPFSPSGTLV